MKAVVLAGGKGTRLFPLTRTISKPMMSFLNGPLLEHIVVSLVWHGLGEIIVAVGGQRKETSSYLGDGCGFGAKVEYSEEGTPAGTAGAVKKMEGVLKQTFVVTPGDIVTDVDLRRAIWFHREKGSLVTMLLSRVRDPLQFGLVQTDEEGRIVRFEEKPERREEAFTDVVNAGIYVLEPEVLKYIPKDRFFDFSKDLFPKLLASGVPMFGLLTDGYWCDVGTLVQYRQAHFDALNGQVRLLALPVREGEALALVDESAEIDSGAELVPPLVVGAGARIMKQARVGPLAVVGEEATLEENSVVSDSILLGGARVGRASRVSGCIVGDGVRVGEGQEWLNLASDGKHRVTIEGRPGVRASREPVLARQG